MPRVSKLLRLCGCVQALRKIGQDFLILMLCVTIFLSYLPEAGEYSSFFVYLRLVMITLTCTLCLLWHLSHVLDDYDSADVQRSQLRIFCITLYRLLPTQDFLFIVSFSRFVTFDAL